MIDNEGSRRAAGMLAFAKKKMPLLVGNGIIGACKLQPLN
jgi:hypothetical protein